MLSGSKLGSNLGPFAPKYHAKRGYDTQNQAKRNNRLANRLLVRDQGFKVQISFLAPPKSRLISELEYSPFCKKRTWVRLAPMTKSLKESVDPLHRILRIERNRVQIQFSVISEDARPSRALHCPKRSTCGE